MNNSEINITGTGIHKERAKEFRVQFEKRQDAGVHRAGIICGSGCPICDYFRTLGANVIPNGSSVIPDTLPDILDYIVPNDFSRIVDRMGGDPPAKINEDECIRHYLIENICVEHIGCLDKYLR